MGNENSYLWYSFTGVKFSDFSFLFQPLGGTHFIGNAGNYWKNQESGKISGYFSPFQHVNLEVTGMQYFY